MNYANAVKSKPRAAAASENDTPSCLMSPHKTDEVEENELLPDATETLSALRLRTTKPLLLATKNPLPTLGWADPKRVWRIMTKKEKIYPRFPKIFERNPAIQPNMRTILLDWLIEVQFRNLFFLFQFKLQKMIVYVSILIAGL